MEKIHQAIQIIKAQFSTSITTIPENRQKRQKESKRR
jgi:hypothetical protein